MKTSELKPNTIFKVIGGELPIHYWLYTGNHASSHTCSFCHQVREYTHEFLHYESLGKLKNDVRINDLGRWDTAFHFGSECVKAFIAVLTIDDIVS